MVRTGDREQRSRRALPGLAASKGRSSRVMRWPLLGGLMTPKSPDVMFDVGLPNRIEGDFCWRRFSE